MVRRRLAPDEKMRPLTVNFTEKQHRELDLLAAKEDRPTGWFVRAAVQQYLDRRAPDLAAYSEKEKGTDAQVADR